MDNDGSCLLKQDLALLEVFGGHQTKALARDLGDHDGDAELSVAGPVLHLALPAAVGDGVTLGTLGQLPLPRHSHLTLVTTSSVCHVLWHDAKDLTNLRLFDFLKE